jgi:hypothetical protein
VVHYKKIGGRGLRVRAVSGDAIPPRLTAAERDALPYYEAYPRLAARDVADALLRGLECFEWAWRDDGAAFGWGAVARPSNQVVVVTVKCKLALGGKSQVVLSTLRATNYPDRRAFSLFRCPQCRQNRKEVVLATEWGCVKCSGLIYRSQRKSSEVRQWEKMRRLEGEIGDGRPKGMHRQTYAGKRTELKLLREHLGGVEAVAPRELRHSLDCVWLRLPEGTPRSHWADSLEEVCERAQHQG